MLSNTGPIARTARDAAMMMDLIARYDPADDMALADDGVDYVGARKGSLKGLRGVWISKFGEHSLDPEIETAARMAAKTLEQLGIELEEREVPATEAPPTGLVWWTLWIGSLQRLLSQFPAERHTLMDSTLARMAEDGAKVTLDQYVAALADARKIGHAWNLLLSEFDLVLTPMMAVQPFDVGRTAPENADGTANVMWSPYSATFNITRHPAISVPTGLSSQGLPLAMQMISGHGRDALLLRVAHKLLRTRPFEIPDLPLKYS
jgi:aspartyl-tRNA(Asn)/glutamyl-tRNA(Gln) amidotransferase subunit A